MIVYCQQWEESERGWGVRPDGYSLHLTKEEAEKYAEETMKRQQKYFRDRYGDDRVPDEYSRPAGNPYPCKIDGRKIRGLKEEKSIRFYENNYPKPLGILAGAWV